MNSVFLTLIDDNVPIETLESTYAAQISIIQININHSYTCVLHHIYTRNPDVNW